jgi:two-component system NtrC family response regulator
MDKILIVDDEPGVRESLRFSLKDRYDIVLAENGARAIELAERIHPDLIILDVMLPDVGGMDVLKAVRSGGEDVPVIMLTAVSQVKTAVDAMKAGACEYITKPFDVEELKIMVANVMKTGKLAKQVSFLKEEINREYPVGQIVYKSSAMSRVLKEAKKVAVADSSVLLTGPTGTGKELVARFIHDGGKRAQEPFVPVHCAAIPEGLFESEIFGYEKGAFTGAVRNKQGKIEIARSGTLFFDEVSEIPLPAQVKLLRFLQEKEFSRLGGNDTVKSGARIISASSADLQGLVNEKKFRDDLFYRLGVIPISIPALKERREDIRELVDFYFAVFKKQLLCKTRGFSHESMDILCGYDWPGNVRELKNIIERILVLKGNKSIIESCDLPVELGVSPRKPAYSLKEEIEDFERKLIRETLESSGWNQTKTAESLKTTRRILRYKMERYGLGNGQKENPGN